MLRDEVQERAPATESAGSGYRLDNTPNYYCREYALHKDIADSLRSNEDSPLNSDTDATAFLTQKAMIHRDRVFATNFLAASLWTGRADRQGAASGPTGVQFIQFDQTASTPIQEITSDMDTIQSKIGLRPNVLVVGAEVWTKLRNHAQFLDAIKYTTGPAIVTEALVAQCLGLDRVVVSRAIYNSAKEGQTATPVFVTGKKMLLCYAAPAPSLMQPSAGYIFDWSGRYGVGAMGIRMKKMRAELRDADRIEIEYAFDMKVVTPEAGIYYYDVVA
jgi:hypothetical protein